MNLYTILISGLTTGTLYGLVGVGLNVAFRPTGVFNFAHGDFVMLAALLAAGVQVGGPLRWFVPLGITVVAIGALGVVTERAAVAPLARRGAGGTSWIISTLAVSLIIETVATKFWGSNTYLIQPPAFLSTSTFGVGGAFASTYDIGLVVAGPLVVLLLSWMYRSNVGRGMLAVAEDRDAALLQGIRPGRLSMLAFAVGGAVAACVGLLAGPSLYGSVSLGPVMLLGGFEAAAIGGVGSNGGALLAGYLLGLVGAASSAQWSPGYASAATFVVLLVVLLIRPHGLFGKGVIRYI